MLCLLTWGKAGPAPGKDSSTYVQNCTPDPGSRAACSSLPGLVSAQDGAKAGSTELNKKAKMPQPLAFRNRAGGGRRWGALERETRHLAQSFGFHPGVQAGLPYIQVFPNTSSFWVLQSPFRWVFSNMNKCLVCSALRFGLLNTARMQPGRVVRAAPAAGCR